MEIYRRTILVRGIGGTGYFSRNQLINNGIKNTPNHPEPPYFGVFSRVRGMEKALQRYGDRLEAPQLEL